MTGHEAGTSPTGLTLLYVGFDSDTRDQISAAVQKWTPYDVTTLEAGTVDSALQLVRERSIDCVVSEYHLEERSGTEIAHQAADVDVSVVLFVEDGSEPIASEAFSSGVDDYVPRGDGSEVYRELADAVSDTVVENRREANANAMLTDVPVDSLPIILFSIDCDGIITHSRGEGLRNIGLEPGELVGQSLYETYGDLTETIDAYESALTGEQSTISIELGGRIIETTFAPLHDGEAVTDVAGLSIDVTDQVAAERQAQQLYTAIDSTMDGIALLDDSGEYVYVNEAHAETYGFDEPEEMIGKSWELLYDEDELERFQTEVMPELGREGEWRGEAVGTRVDGTQFPQELTLTGLDSGGLICVVRDITERKAMTEELERAKRELQSVLDNALAVVYKKDPEGRYQYVNEQYEELLGLSRDEFIGKTTDGIYDDESLIESTKAFEHAAIEAGEPIAREVEAWIDDRRRTFLTTVIPLFDEGGEFYTLYGIATEITEVKERERVLHSLITVGSQLMSASTPASIAQVATETANEVLDLPITGVWFHESEENALVPFATTDRADHLFDEQPVFQPGNSVAWEVFENDEPQVLRDVAAAPNVHDPETPIRSEMLFPLADHGVLICGSLQCRHFDEYDQEFGTILAALTTSALTRADRELALKQRERELERKNDRLEEFASVVAHDIRSPLTVAKGYLELERESGDGRYLEKIEEGVDRTAEIVDNLLSLARAGKEVGELEPVDIDHVAKTAWSTVRTDEAQLLLEGEMTVEGDRLRLTQLFENLFRNAIEHGATDVTVRVGELDRGRGFYIEDDGSGIPDGERETLLTDRRLRDDNAERRFGLAIVTDIVDAHGWGISIAEGSEGGARFEIVTTEGSPVYQPIREGENQS